MKRNNNTATNNNHLADEEESKEHEMHISALQSQVSQISGITRAIKNQMVDEEGLVIDVNSKFT